MAKVSSVNFGDVRNYVSYNDSDMTTDYFHGYLLTQKETIESIKERGSDEILTTTTNNDYSIPTLRRIKAICKGAGYEYKDVGHLHTYESGKEVYIIEYVLTKIYPSSFIVLWNDGTEEDFFKSALMDARNRDIFIKDLKENGIRRIVVREFK